MGTEELAAEVAGEGSDAECDICEYPKGAAGSERNQYQLTVAACKFKGRKRPAKKISRHPLLRRVHPAGSWGAAAGLASARRLSAKAGKGRLLRRARGPKA
ncbi:MAG: hypothetical protein U1A06_16915 [Hoeflea sp.]|nr:hypothetical protein [Hoeflea sp.]